ncbi:Synaptic vesicle transporter SVOP and related transporters (major facilitator superfamily) [Ceraceosorus bombacis]|uniref:Synaptic vesicle transporter SVOP and related transporters (Major facilitator superfamily) n=1 Tax=Ceraceosorus bombacis TaxID=401625 RepID=A0A0P1BJN7_9BASI|nr:Synaptic vesicle transporter SVOP and related transporters (major facilitator superfamily) [Ceraceosorus bombacis]
MSNLSATTLGNVLLSNSEKVTDKAPAKDFSSEGVTDDKVTYIHFDPGESPRDWPEWKKWLLLVPIYLVDLSVSWGASGFSPAQMKFAKDLGVSSEVGTLGLSTYVGGLALGPMIQAPVSEYFGRSVVYICGYGIYLLWILGTALSPNLGAFLAFRFLGGAFSSVTIATLGGTVADLFPPRRTGYAMSIYIWAATCGSPSGYFLFSFVAATRGWRDVFWAMLGISGGLWLIMTLVMLWCGESRHDVLLARKVSNQKKQIGCEPGMPSHSGRIDVPPGYERSGVRQLLQVTMTRPFRFLATEPIVTFASFFNGYLYGLVYMFNTAISQVFEGSHGFGTISTGLVFLGLVVGISCGPFINLFGESFYQKRYHQKGQPVPEARVMLAIFASIAQPMALFWFAWTSFPSVHFIVPVIASALWGWAFYALIMASYQYVVDSYGTYSASALAGVGLIRNLAGAGFPLFARQMYSKLGYEWASSLLAFLSLALIPITFVLWYKARAAASKRGEANQADLSYRHVEEHS